MAPRRHRTDWKLLARRYAKERDELRRENANLREQRDRAEMACIDVRITGGKVLDSALAIASAVAQRAKT